MVNERGDGMEVNVHHRVKERPRMLGVATKVEMLGGVGAPAVFYGSETWTLIAWEGEGGRFWHEVAEESFRSVCIYLFEGM